jgi:hypothetical protein
LDGESKSIATKRYRERSNNNNKFRTHIAGPEIAQFLIGFGISTTYSISNNLLIDLHRDQPAAATAAVNFVRCLMSAGGV